MRELIQLPVRTLIILLVVVVSPLAPLQAQLLSPVSEEGDPSPSESRSELLEQWQTQKAAGADESDDLDTRKAYIVTLQKLGYHDLVAEQYELLTHEQPDQGRYWRMAGEAWMLAGPYACEKAFDALQQALVLDEEDIAARALLAHLFHREGLYEQAGQAYEAVVLQDPSHVRARLGQAVLLARDGAIVESSSIIDDTGAAAQQFDVETRLMLRRALSEFERRGGWFDDTASNHGAYARLLYRAGRITHAVLAARRATTLDADDYETWNFFAAMQLQLGNIEQAEQAYARSLEANPDQPGVTDARRQLINQMTMQQRVTGP